VFALANSDQQLDRLIIGAHFRLVSSGCSGPTSAPSASRTSRPARLALDRQPSVDAESSAHAQSGTGPLRCQLTLAELPQVYLWGRAYKVSSVPTAVPRHRISIAGLLRCSDDPIRGQGTSMFPGDRPAGRYSPISASFRLPQRGGGSRPDGEQIWRAGTGIGLAATFVVIPIRLPQPQPMARPFTARWCGSPA
jgi:hypothetical protein